MGEVDGAEARGGAERWAGSDSVDAVRRKKTNAVAP